MNPDRTTQFEEIVAYQQRLLDELNEVMTTLRTEVDHLAAEQARLKSTVNRLVEFHESAEDTPNEPPPHY